MGNQNWINSAIQPSKAPNQELFSTIQEMSSRVLKAEAELMVVYCWVIWSVRNTFIFEGKLSDSRIAAARAESALKAFQRVSKSGAGFVSQAREAAQQAWKPPPQNVVKLNVDAAVNSLEQRSGLGAVIRDAEGRILAAGITQVQLREGVSSAEAEAILWGLTIAKQVCSSLLIVESDCKEVIELLNNTKGSRTEIHWILSDILRISKDFQHVKFSFIPRICNAYAHVLAKLALTNYSTDVWVDSIPAAVQNVLTGVVV